MLIRRRLTLALLLLSVGWAAADDPVARVQSINPADGSGKAVLRQKRPGDEKGFAVSVNSIGYLKDHYITDGNTLAALEFLIGGRVGINKDTDIEIVNERSVADGKTSAQRVLLKNGSLWIKADAKQLKQPLEIQTSGGTMAIKGTELTVDTEEDGTVEVCCFESDSELGGVQVHDAEGKVVGIAKPGDQYRLHRLRPPVFKRFKDIQQFRESILDGPRFRTLHRHPFFAKKFLGELGKVPPAEVAFAFYQANRANNVEKNPGQSWRELAAKMKANRRRQAHSLQADFPSQLVPDQTTSGPFPQFGWQGVPQADGYLVMLSRDENFAEVIFSERVSAHSVDYPPSMRPLAEGKYFWRVVPVDAQDRPVFKASQTHFMVNKS